MEVFGGKPVRERVGRFGEEGNNLGEPIGFRSGDGGRCRLTVTPLCPPITGMVMVGAKEGFPSFSATKVEARTTSRVVTPKSLK